MPTIASFQWSRIDITVSWTFPIAFSTYFCFLNAETTEPAQNTMAAAIYQKSNTLIRFRGKFAGEYWNHNMSYSAIGI